MKTWNFKKIKNFIKFEKIENYQVSKEIEKFLSKKNWKLH